MSAAHELRARRIRRVRRRVVATALAVFVLAWGLVAFAGTTGTTPTTVATTSAAPAATPGSLTTRQS
jgi:hypothetical protein